MTREIKFRGKDIKTGEWLYVDLRNKEGAPSEDVFIIKLGKRV